MSDTWRRPRHEPEEGALPEPNEVWTYADQAEAEAHLAWANEAPPGEDYYQGEARWREQYEPLNERPRLTLIRGGRAGS